jgi:peptidyl-prolyl cis-trans isomerase C
MTGPNAKQKLEQMRDEEIQNSATKFASCAKQHSACPSKGNGGNLGRFEQGAMAPPFDRAVFDKDQPLEKTIGPVETQFGWHLIYINKRQINN